MTVEIGAFCGRVPVPDGEISTFLSHYRAEKGLQSRYDITDQVRGSSLGDEVGCLVSGRALLDV